MKVTIVPPDDIVIVDGYPLRGLDLSSLTGVHAVQWDGESGHIEYVDARPNEAITSIAAFESILNAHASERYLIENPIYTLDQRRQIQITKIKTAFDAAPSLGLQTSLGYRVNATRTDKSNVEELLDYCQRNSLPGTSQFRIYDNSFVAASVANLQTIINEIQEFGLGLYARKWAKETAIEAATTEEAALAITWESEE